jgi:hypothetical protein
MDAALPKNESFAEVSYPGCSEDVPLSEIRPGKPDKLGNNVVEIFWCGEDYIVYRSSKGVFVHFSDDPKVAKIQRRAFTEICPELCELRYLTEQMEGSARIFGLPVFGSPERDSIFDHNIAQAIMLLMEHKKQDAKDIAESALKLAVSRATNDNTIRYVVTSAYTAIIITTALTAYGFIDISYYYGSSIDYIVAAGAGSIGAFFSIITRLQSLELKPCQESHMNYLVSVMRILMGLIAALFLVLLAKTSLGGSLLNGKTLQTWTGVAVIGFVGGFAERLVQTIAQRSASAMGDRAGTPVQVARNAQHAGRQGRS